MLDDYPQPHHQMADSCSNSTCSLVEAICDDVLIDIIGRIGSHSVTDLFNFKLANTSLMNLGEDNHVYRSVSMDRFPVAPWPISNRYMEFYEKCREVGNPEADFRDGLHLIFSLLDIHAGIQKMSSAVEKGYTPAIYVWAVLYLFSQPQELRLEGVRLMSLLSASDMRDSRIKFKKVLDEFWVRARYEVEVVDNCGCRAADVSSNWEPAENIGCPNCYYAPQVTFFKKVIADRCIV